jgi:hypothetical protein
MDGSRAQAPWGRRIADAGLPPEDRWPHGTRSRYVRGCRCDECRAANRRYSRERALAVSRGRWDGYRPREASQKHLEWLRTQGVGLRAVSAATDIPRTTLARIVKGAHPWVRGSTEQKILAVTPDVRGDWTLVDAGPTWERIAWLLEEGFTRGELARLLGSKTPALQLGRKKVRAATAARVERLFRKYQH